MTEMTKPNGWTGDTWRWECTTHGGLRNSTWNLVSSNGDVVLEGVKGVELVKNDKYTKLVRAAPSLYEALKSATVYIEALESFTGYNLEVLNWHKNGDTAPFDGFFDENRGDFDLAKARADLSAAEGGV